MVTDPALPYAGIELGGTKCVCTLAHGPDAILAQETIATRDPETTLSAVAAVLARWWQEPGFAAIGIGSFGPVDLDPASATYGSMLATPKPGWPGADVVGRLTAGLPVPVAFDTDVNGAALAEMRWGSGRGLRDFAYVTVGTGVGVGLVVHGLPTRGIGHSEMGHLRVPRLPGATAPGGCPFHPDCVEGLASGPGIRAALGGQDPALAAEDHPVWDQVAAALTALAHALACATGPFRVAMGGGVLARRPHLLPRIQHLLVESLNGYLTLPEGPYVVAPALGDQAGPLGSIALAISAAEGAAG